jgi:hypothetical protein
LERKKGAAVSEFMILAKPTNPQRFAENKGIQGLTIRCFVEIG